MAASGPGSEARPKMAMERGGELPRSPRKNQEIRSPNQDFFGDFSIFRGQKNQLTTAISPTWWASGSYCQRSAGAKLGSAAETWLVVSDI